MIVYWDPSAWVKAYVREDHHESIQKLFEQAAIHTSSVLAYVEMHAAIAAMRRSGRSLSATFDEIILKVEEDWQQFVPIFPEPVLIGHSC
jgi:uncharacterized protein